MESQAKNFTEEDDACSQLQTASQIRTQSQSQSQSRSQSHIPPLYGVYLLNSLTKKNSYYVGSTPDPHRRLRQHNGELSCGGAYRTKKQGFRPWRLVFYVYGFPSKISALQFEHAWQHAYQTRHIPFEKRLNPGSKQSGSGTSIHGKIANCRLLLNSDSFKRLGLKVAIFNKSVYDVWLKNRYAVYLSDDIQVDIRINSESLDDSVIMGGNYNQLKDFMETNLRFQNDYFRKCETIFENLDLTENISSCQICGKNIEVAKNLSTLCTCTHNGCECVYHLSCLAARFIEDEDLPVDGASNKNILPTKGKCLGCKKINFWNLIVRGSMYINSRNN